jgi:Tol biopolymer transport system component
MKKFQVVFLIMFLVGCSASQTVVPTETPSVILIPSTPTQTLIPPTQTTTPLPTSTPPPTPTALGGGEGKIAFVSERDGYQEIYLINSDGSNLIKVTNSITPKGDPAWSPDGKKIAFASNNDDSASLYIMNTSSSNPTKLIDAKDLSINSQATPDWQLGIGRPVWSPDGKKIAFSASHYIGGSLIFFNIYVINADGSNLVSPADHSALDSNPAWSPDSQKIAFDSGVEWDKVGFVTNSCGGSGGICVMNADGTDPINLPHKKGGEGNPSWSPDGKKIAFNSSRNGDSEIFVMNSDGTDPINLTHYGSAWDHGPSWSPDGKRIAFSSYRDGNYEIYVMNSDGTQTINLTNHRSDDSGGVWSPDSAKIAFVSGRDGNSEIYVINIDGSNLVRLTNNDASDYAPVWSP